jgi:hypothetical protein
VKAWGGGVGGSPKREEGMGGETEREEKGETSSRFHSNNENGGIDWNLRDWGGHDGKLQKGTGKREPHMSALTLHSVVLRSWEYDYNEVCCGRLNRRVYSFSM